MPCEPDLYRNLSNRYDYLGDDVIFIEPKYLQIIKKIDSAVIKVYSPLKSDEENDRALLELFQEFLFEFRVVLDGLGSRLDEVCERYLGFYIFSSFVERFAQATASGAFDDILERIPWYLAATLAFLKAFKKLWRSYTFELVPWGFDIFSVWSFKGQGSVLSVE